MAKVCTIILVIVAVLSLSCTLGFDQPEDSPPHAQIRILGFEQTPNPPILGFQTPNTPILGFEQTPNPPVLAENPPISPNPALGLGSGLYDGVNINLPESNYIRDFDLEFPDFDNFDNIWNSDNYHLDSDHDLLVPTIYPDITPDVICGLPAIGPFDHEVLLPEASSESSEGDQLEPLPAALPSSSMHPSSSTSSFQSALPEPLLEDADATSSSIPPLLEDADATSLPLLEDADATSLPLPEDAGSPMPLTEVAAAPSLFSRIFAVAIWFTSLYKRRKS